MSIAAVEFSQGYNSAVKGRQFAAVAEAQARVGFLQQ
jgi:hypothetical protein